MKNSEVFLSTYNKLDNHLRKMDNAENYASFTSVVKRLKNNHRIIRHYHKKLIEYNELRNAIVHDRIDGTVIAEPNDFAVKDFGKIYDNISSPKQINEVCAHKVKCLNQKNKLIVALNLMKDHDYSQIPIYENKSFVGMLNAETITLWMAHQSSQEGINLSETKISEVLTYRNQYRKTIFKSRDSDIFEILNIYKNNVHEPKQIDAIVITHNGKPTEKPLTIVTDYDLPSILEHC